LRYEEVVAGHVGLWTLTRKKASVSSKVNQHHLGWLGGVFQ